MSSDVDERTLREIYLPAFERIVKAAQPWTIMCAYNKVNGTWASQNHWLLTEVLRDEWGFQGLVVSDWGAVADRVAAVRAGLDLEMPPAKDHSEKAIVAAAEAGELSLADVIPACAGCWSWSARGRTSARAPPPWTSRRTTGWRVRPPRRAACCWRTTACCRWPLTRGSA